MTSISLWKRQLTYWKENYDSFQYRKHIITHLQKDMRIDSYCFSIVDPQTLCSLGAVTDEVINQLHGKIIALEQHPNTIDAYHDLWQHNNYFQRLSDTKIEDNYRYQRLLRLSGYTDEIRMCLPCGAENYGYLTLFRTEGYFTNYEAQYLVALQKDIAQHLKDYYYVVPTTQSGVYGNGCLIMNQVLKVTSGNEEGLSFMYYLQQQEGTLHLPKLLQTLYMKCHKEQATISLLTPIKDLGYFKVTATVVATKNTEIIILIQAATNEMITAHLMQAYQLTERESDIAVLLIQGKATKDIASQLSLSPHTVQDHLKQVFKKAQVHNRTELSWKLCGGIP